MYIRTTGNYRILSAGEISLPQDRAHHYVIQYQMLFLSETITTGGFVFLTETMQRSLHIIVRSYRPGSLYVCSASTAYLHRVSHHFVSSLWSLCILDSCFNSALPLDWLWQDDVTCSDSDDTANCKLPIGKMQSIAGEWSLEFCNRQSGLCSIPA